jgi:hypothetical protein
MVAPVPLQTNALPLLHSGVATAVDGRLTPPAIIPAATIAVEASSCEGRKRPASPKKRLTEARRETR